MRTAYVVAPEADAADAVQEAFLKAYAALPRFREGAPFRPWLLTIVANEARNRRRSAERRSGLALRAAASNPGAAVAASPEAEVLGGGDARPSPSRSGRAPRRGSRGDRRSLPARTFRGRDGRVAVPADGHGEVADLPRPRTVARIARRHRGRTGRWLTSRCHGCTSPPTKDLEAALRSMADDIAWPAAAPTDGRRTSQRSSRRGLTGRAGPPRAQRQWRPRWTWRPATRALVIALVVLLALAALVGAAGLGLPGLRIIFGGPEPSPTAPAVPSASKGVGAVGSRLVGLRRRTGGRRTAATLPGPLGTGLGLGMEVDAAAVDALAGFHVRGRPTGRSDRLMRLGSTLPTMTRSRSSGPRRARCRTHRARRRPRSRWRSGERSTRAGSRRSSATRTKVETVTVNGHRGFWISGEPHQFFYEGPNGFVDEPRRWVGDALLWSDGPITYRLETSLGRDAAIAVAESMR